MGPTIITDKNAIQSLSQSEIHFLFKYYYVNIPPILVREILADLLKESNNNYSSEDNTMILARKLLSSDSSINMNYLDLILNELMGTPIQMKRRTLAASQKVSKDGKCGVTTVLTDEEKIIRNMKDGIFSSEDYTQAQNWITSIKQINPEEIKKMSFEIINSLKDLGINSMNELDILIIDCLNNEKFQSNLLELIIDTYKFTQYEATQVFFKWETSNKPLLKNYCPYTYYCTHTLMLWYLGTLKGFFGGKTNILDLEYLFYLPFSNIFVSNDKFHQKIIPYLLEKDQFFITADEIKSDLRSIANKWKSLNDQEKIDWQLLNDNQPTLETPLTLKIWNTCFLNKDFEIFNSSDDFDYMEIRSQININECCHCGSGVPYKNCHGK